MFNVLKLQEMPDRFPKCLICISYVTSSVDPI